MKMTRTLRAVIATTAVAVIGAGVMTVPSSAATRSTVVFVPSNVFTSLNPSTPAGNVVINGQVAYLTGMGFNYYNDKSVVVPNKIFGSYKIAKNTATDFQTSWTVNKGRVWSDGTPIDGVDLLLSHILASPAYSKAAGLGDPADKSQKPAFDSLGYSGVYAKNIVGDPVLSADKMTVTLKFKQPIANWDVRGPGPSPVHTLVRLAEGKKTLGTLKENLAAKAKFLKAFQTKDTALLTKIGKIWSTAYDINQIDAKTNPLLLVSNGAYLVRAAEPKQTVTMTLNPKYNSGPKTNGIKTIVFRMIADGLPSAQALANGEVDLYDGQPNADTLFLLKSVVGVNVVGGGGATYEHVDFRTGAAFGSDQTYTGPFAGYSQRARDLRAAAALAWPRDEIVEKLIKPINNNAVVMQSLTQFPSEASYSKMVNNSGIKEFTEGTQESRTAAALALVKKYYPSASATNPGFTIKLLWGTPTNARRAAEAQIVIAALAKAGIKVEAPGVVAWGGLLDSATYDASFFAWQKTAIVQDAPCGTFKGDSANNYQGYASKVVDDACAKLQGGVLTYDQTINEYLNIEKQLMKDVVSLPIFQFPAVVAHRSTLLNVKRAPLSPNSLWNFWEWKYSA